MKSIQWQLISWLLAGLLIATSLAGWGIYSIAHQEANQLFDYYLRQAALSVPYQLNTDSDYSEKELGEDIYIQVWSPADELIFTSNADFAMPRYKALGFQDIDAFGLEWRLFSESRNGYFVQVAQPESVRDLLAQNLALRSLIPFAFLIPLLMILMGISVRRNLRPLHAMAQAIKARSPVDLTPVKLQEPVTELAPITNALNDLLARLDHALSSQREFIADAAHELRSPLTALKLQVQLAERAKTEPQRIQAVNKLGERIQRTIYLVEQMLTLAKHEMPTQELTQRVDLNQLMQHFYDDYQVYAKNHDLSMQLALHSEPVWVVGSAQELAILIKNLVENALHYTPAGGVITLITQAGKQPRLCVRDTGSGIPFEERERVFDRFYRCVNNEIAGTGLGLAIVQNIARHHKAKVILDDNPHGQGLQVCVVFDYLLSAA